MFVSGGFVSHVLVVDPNFLVPVKIQLRTMTVEHPPLLGSTQRASVEPIQGSGHRSGFGTQVLSTFRRQMIQKRRALTSTLLEMLLPLIFVLALAIGSFAANTDKYPDTQFVHGPPLNLAAALEDAMCVNGTSSSSGVMSLLPQCNTTLPIACTNSYLLPVSNVCLTVSGLPMMAIMGVLKSFEEPIYLLDFDHMVLLQWGAKLFIGPKSYGLFSASVSTALYNSGALYFVPNSNATQQVVQTLNTTFKLFQDVFAGIRGSRGDVIPSIVTSAGEGKTWGIISVESDDAPKSFTFQISLNHSSIPATTSVRNQYSRGVSSKDYVQYFASGFLTLQETLDRVFINSAFSTDPSPPLALVPMGYLAYDTNVFYQIAGPLAPFAMVLSFLYMVSQLSKRLVEEKEQRLREGTMIMGLSKSAFFVSWLGMYYIQVSITCTLSSILLSAILLKKSAFTVILIVYVVFGLTAVNTAALLSTLFNKARLAALMVPLIYFIMAFPAFAIPDGTANGVFYLVSFIPPVPFSIANKLLFNYELENGVGWNMVGSPNEIPYNVGFAIAALIVMFFVTLLLTLYLDAVLPKEWGTSANVCFCFCSCFGSKSHRSSENERLRDEKYRHDNSPRPFMTAKKGTAHLDVCENFPARYNTASLQIQGISKTFNKKVAVDNMDLCVFPDMITVLLGHNGAGKTTLVNLLTGMMEVTSGDAIIYGNSVRENIAAVRSEIGFCPQHNILWDDLTCFEHLQYFARLKGVPSDKVNEQALHMLDKVDLADKKDVYSCQLSGGQKRKLSVAIAFIGGSRLILLDEPTAGMDVAARRHTWDVLQEMAIGRTIILTTHFMDEADLLGRRVAIMSKGSLYSYGSPMFLKNNLGTGYVLKLSCTTNIQNREGLLGEITRHVPSGSLQEVKGQEAQFSLPKEQVKNFPKLIRHLESKEVSAKYGIGSVAMTVSTLEDVFLRIAEMEELREDETLEDRAKMEGENQERVHRALGKTYESMRQKKELGDTSVGFSRQLMGLIVKRFHYIKRDRRTLFLQLVMPVFSIVLAMALSEIKQAESGSLAINLGMYGSGTHQITLNNCSKYAPFYDPAYVKDLTYENSTQNFSSYLVSHSLHHGDREQFTSVSCDDTHWTPATTTLFVNATGVHNAPQALQDYYLAVARNVYNATAASVKPFDLFMGVSSYPLPLTDRETVQVDSIAQLMLALFVLIPYTFIPSTYVAFIVKERECKAKHLQFVSGVNFVVYWVSNFIFDIVCFVATLTISFIIFIIFNKSAFVGTVESFFATLTVMLLYGISGIFAAYAVSFFFDNHGSAQNIVMLSNFMIGFVLVLMSYILQYIDSTKSLMKVLIYFFRVVPAFCMGNGLLAISNSVAMAPLTLNPPSLFSFDVAGWDILYMCLTSVGFLLITVFVDHPQRKAKRQLLSFNRDAQAPNVEDEDDDVEEERRVVEGNLRPDDVVTVKKLRKVYDLGGGKEKVAVQNITFGVKKGEVFGFLGTNGAGKTTTVSILTGEFLPNMGHASITGYDVVTNAQEARKVTGYCPQFDALIDLLTPQEHLNLYAALRGIPIMDTASVVDALIEACGLEEYRSIQSGSLSGGNKRKLSVALSLIGGPSVVLLDEPSAGMDPFARRQLWDVIVFVAAHSSVVLTTHHLEEVDKLAHRVGIMDQGLMKCLGTLGHLKKKFGGGFELTLKVKQDHAQAAISYIKRTFPEAHLVEERQERLIFSLPADSANLADLFEEIFKAKENSSLGIEDYMVQQTALEQVFLRIAEQNSRTEEEEQRRLREERERLSKSNRSQNFRSAASASQLANEPLDPVVKAEGYSASFRLSRNKRQKSEDTLPLTEATKADTEAM